MDLIRALKDFKQRSLTVSKKAPTVSKKASPFSILPCEPFFPLHHSKTPETPNLSKICPSDCFWGFQSGGRKFEKICQNLSENCCFSNFDKFFQIFVPLSGTPQNNRWDKFWTSLGFRAFLNAVRGKRVRKYCQSRLNFFNPGALWAAGQRDRDQSD